jgi:hypothetical protein
MNDMPMKTSEVQFIVGEDWAFGPSTKLVAIPVIDGDISRETIGPHGVERLARECVKALHTCLVMCEETPVIRPDYLRDAGDKRADYVMSARDEKVYADLVRHLSACEKDRGAS